MSEREIDGGPAFPHPFIDSGNGSGFVSSEELGEGGMRLREYLIAHSPVDFACAGQAYAMTFGRQPDLGNDDDRRAFFSTWAMMRAEMADAQLREARFR